jgi:hypothetical protein
VTHRSGRTYGGVDIARIAFKWSLCLETAIVGSVSIGRWLVDVLTQLFRAKSHASLRTARIPHVAVHNLHLLWSLLREPFLSEIHHVLALFLWGQQDKGTRGTLKCRRNDHCFHWFLSLFNHCRWLIMIVRCTLSSWWEEKPLWVNILHQLTGDHFDLWLALHAHIDSLLRCQIKVTLEGLIYLWDHEIT